MTCWRRRAVHRFSVSLGAPLLALSVACDRPVAPMTNSARPVNVAMLSPVDALDVDTFVTDGWLAADGGAGCAGGPIFSPTGQSRAGLRVVSTRLPDGSLLRMRGLVGAVEDRGSYIEVLRDWPRGTGMRVGSYNVASDTVWVMRYGPSGKGRATDERPVSDPEAAATLALLRRQFAALACPASLNRRVNLGKLVPLWEPRKRDGWEWRDAWPPRPGRGGARSRE